MAQLPVSSLTSRESIARRCAAPSPAALTCVVAVAVALSGCALPDWIPRPGFETNPPPPPPQATRVLGPDAFVSADGRCSAPIGEAPPPAAVGLDMSECEVVRRSGPPDRIDIAANERGERTATLVYSRGERPGIYRFVSGRLVVVEQAPTPPPIKPAKKKKAAKKASPPPG